MSEPPLLDAGAADRAAHNLALQLDDRDHPDVETDLTAYVDGLLAADARASVDEHLATCARCREDVADLAATAAAIRRPRAHPWRWLAVAAVLVLAITIAVVRSVRKPAPSPVTPVVVQATQTTTVVAPVQD